jgi:hypothetical protein
MGRGPVDCEVPGSGLAASSRITTYVFDFVKIVAWSKIVR